MTTTPRHPESQDVAPAQGLLASSRAMFEYLTTAVALSRDRTLLSVIRERGGTSADRTVIPFGRTGPFVHLKGDEIDRCTIDLGLGDADETAHLVDLQALLERDGPTCDALRAAHERTGFLTEVAHWLRAFASGGDAIARDTFRAIATWHPLLAVESYRQVAHASAALDVERRELVTAAERDEAPPQALLSYWALIHLIGNAALIATMGGEHDWLAGLARSLPHGGNWTPSFVLVRERCVRLALRAGWAAAAFGEAVIPRYLATLLPGVAPLRVFDAVLGLSAIGVRHPGLAKAIGRELGSALAYVQAAATGEERLLFEAMARSANLVIGEPARARRWAESHARWFLMNGDEDCAHATEDGLFPVIVALAYVVPAPADALFPSAAQLERLPIRRRPTHQRARQVLLRTGATSSSAEPAHRWVN